MEQNALSVAGPVSRQLYAQLIAAVKGIGPFNEEMKKTSIHLVRSSAFAGVHPRKQNLIVTVKADQAIPSPRIGKAEQVSRNRWHLDVKLASSGDIDEELLNWLRQAYNLCG